MGELKTDSSLIEGTHPGAYFPLAGAPRERGAFRTTPGRWVAGRLCKVGATLAVEGMPKPD